MSKLFEALQRAGERLDVPVDPAAAAIKPGVIESLEHTANGAPSRLPPELEFDSLSTISGDVPERTSIKLEGATRATCEIRDESRVAAKGTAQAAAMERFRVLDHRLHQLRKAQALKRILVTSAGPGEGKTVVSTNLAIVLARTSSRVLLVDGDLRRPSTNRALGLTDHRGVTDVLAGRVSLESAIRFLEPPANIYHLGAGEDRSNSAEMLKSDAAHALFDQLAECFEWVIVDSCPVLPFSDSLRLATMTDGALLVVRSGVTRRKEMREMLTALEGRRICGIVLNGSAEIRDSRYYRYYTA